MTAAFNELRMSVKDANGEIRPANELLEDVFWGLSEIEDPALRASAATELLGKSGAALAPLMKDGAAGLEKLLGKMDELGGGLSDDALSVLGEAGDRFDEFDFSILSLKSRLAVDLIPSINESTRRFTKWLGAITKTTEGTNIFKAAVVVFGAAATKVAIGIYAKYLPIVALLAMAVLVVDDLITAFKGGDSAAAKLIDKLLGKGAGKDFFKWINEGVDDMGKRMDKLPTFAEKTEEVFASVGSTLTKFFVDDIPDAWDLMWLDLNKKAKTGGKTMSDLYIAMFKDLLKSGSDFFKEIGDAIVAGFIKAFVESKDSVKDTIKKFFSSVIDTGEKTLVVKSPSKKSEYLGDMWIAGFVNAVRRGVTLVQAANEYTFGHGTDFEPNSATAAQYVIPQIPAVMGDSFREIRIQNQITQTFEPSTAGVARAAREGVGDALTDNRRLIMALEPSI